GEGNVLRLTPPLVINEDQISTALQGIDAVCASLDQRASDEVARAIGALEPRPRLTLARAATEPHISFPLPKLCLPSSPSYAFLIHSTQDDDVKLTDPPLARLSADELQSCLSYLSRLPFGVVVRATPVRSATGAVAEGLILALPKVPREMMRQGRSRVGEEI